MSINEFLNREELLIQVNNSIKEYKQIKSYHKVFFINGIGGIGKTRFSEEIVKQNQESNMNIEIINLSIHVNNTYDLLLKIRKAYSNYNTNRFDYIFLKFWSIHRSEALNEEYKKLLESSLLKQFSQFDKGSSEDKEKLLRLVKSALKKIDFPNNESLDNFKKICSSISKSPYLPLDFIIEIIKSFIEIADKSIKDKKYSEYLSKINEEKFDKYLYKILIEDINDSKNYSNNKVVLIFDSFKDIFSNKYYSEILNFIYELNSGVQIIFSRNEIESDACTINEKITSRLNMSTLESHYIHEYCKKHNIELHSNNISSLVDKSEGIPFFLEIALKNLEVNNKICFKNKNSFMDTYFRNMSEYKKNIYYVLSVIKIYNKPLFDQFFSSKEDYTLSSNSLKYVDKLNEHEIYKIKNIFAENIIDIRRFDNEKINSIIKDYIKCFMYRIITVDSPNVVFIFINNIFDIVIDNNVNIEEYEDDLLDMILYVNDNGYIIELNKKLNLTKSKNIEHLKSFINAITIRESKIKEGIAELENVLRKDVSENYKRIVNLEKLYLSSLNGKYSEVENDFKEAYEELSHSYTNLHYCLRVGLYYSDLLMLKSKFIQALKIVDDNLEKYDKHNAMNNFRYIKMINDFHKLKGHIYRFNFELDQAKNEYEYFDKIEEKYVNLKMKAYYLTTICEVKCYIDPEGFNNIFDEAVKINCELNLNNNLAKLYYSKAIHLIKINQTDNASEFYKKSLQINEKTGYEAGTIFSYLSKCYIDFSQDGRLNDEIVSKIKEIVNTLNVYKYLLLPIYLMNNDNEGIRELSKLEWLNFEKTMKDYKVFIDNIKPK